MTISLRFFCGVGFLEHMSAKDSPFIITEGLPVLRHQ